MSSGFYQNLCVTVFDGERPSYEVQLASVGKDVISLEGSQIVILC